MAYVTDFKLSGPPRPVLAQALGSSGPPRPRPPNKMGAKKGGRPKKWTLKDGGDSRAYLLELLKPGWTAVHGCNLRQVDRSSFSNIPPNRK